MFKTPEIGILKLHLLFLYLFILYHFPSYNLQYENWSDQYEKSTRFFSNMEFGSGFSHKAKINVRITVPILIKIFNLSPLGLVILKSFVGLIFIYLILKMFFLILDDKYLAVLLTISCLCRLWEGCCP